MPLPQRNDVDQHGFAGGAEAAEARRYEAGGHVAQLQAELAQRLAERAVDQRPIATSPGERVVRLLSVGGGYLALLAGYAVAAFAVFRLI